ncbi:MULTISPECIES: MBL fold metallo-hydrolase [unclassified Azospirillum]|uniref:MBL fold metallo-hydrolase n=1 Tax=unclassified Azospirillum TaxID=2630922 RepID=UPI000B635E73|nr:MULTISPECIES: MBL fold metallo-hydrolase [unclassified Azospirillum]SNT11309.1 Glyoxylase, beta-lactamase superfamily II [Azospirillum sp. RU38E]SNT24305.1 Glyoxylase, beta-lactamase superfamily II [Azospirillum sp. RU37A]
MKYAFLPRVTAAMLFAVASPVSISAQAKAPGPQHVVSQQLGGYSIRVGEVRVTSLTDGSVPQDLYKLLRHTTRQNIDTLLTRNFQANPVEASINAFLLEMPGHLILVDTGSGELFGPGNGGKLVGSMSAMGFQPEQVTDILITHAHSDHAGGLVRGGQPVFTNATVYVGKPDVDFFFDRANQARTGYDKVHFDIAQNTLKPYLDAGKVKMFSGTEQILPGISATIHPGHTPGAAFYTLTSKGEQIVFIGDTIHVAAVQFPDPDVTIAYDQDEKRAAEVRKRAFTKFAAHGDLIAAPHLPFPGIGHIRADGKGGYDWVPVTYTNRDGD